MKLGACPNLPHAPLAGTWFRAIQAQHWLTPLQTSHTTTLPGRFNAGNQAAPGYEILYLAENRMVALFEVQSLFGSPMSPGIVIANPRHSWMIINVNLQLQKIVDLTDVAAVQTALETRPWKAELFG
jgi:RES domain-containing protein